MRLALTGLIVLVLAACGGTPRPQPTPMTGTGAPTDTPTAASPQPDSPTPAVMPTGTPAPTPTPAAHGVGDRVQHDDYQFHTVAQVEWWESDNQFIQLDDGNALLTWLVAIEGIDPEGSSYNPFSYRLRGPDGFEYNPTIGRQPRLSSGDLEPGATVQGWLTFEVPAVGGTYRLVWQPRFLQPSVTIEADVEEP